MTAHKLALQKMKDTKPKYENETTYFY